MAQNADDKDDKSGGNDKTARVTEEDLRKDKYPDEDVDGSDEDDQDDASDGAADDGDGSDDTGDDDGKTDDDSADDDDSDDDSKDDSDDDDSDEFVKEFPNIKGDTIVEYARNLEATISKSNTEGKRLFDENETLKRENAELKAGKKPKGSSDKGDGKDETLSPEAAYVRRQMTQEIDAAYTTLKEDYATYIEDTAEYNKFVLEVKTLGEAMRLQKRFLPVADLYARAAAILGWEKSGKVDNKDRLKVALKDKASISKTTSSSAGKKQPKSKVTDAMIRVNREMYPNKTDDEIRKELEPYVQ